MAGNQFSSNLYLSNPYGSSQYSSNSGFTYQQGVGSGLNTGAAPTQVVVQVPNYETPGEGNMSNEDKQASNAQKALAVQGATDASLAAVGLIGIHTAYKQAMKASDQTYENNMNTIASNRNEYRDQYGQQVAQQGINEDQTRNNLAMAIQQNNIQTNNAKMSASQQQLQQRTNLTAKLVGAKSLSLRDAMSAQGQMSAMDHSDEITNAVNSSNAALSKAQMNVNAVQAKNANSNAKAQLAYTNSVQEGKFKSQESAQAVRRAQDKLNAERTKWNQYTQTVVQTASDMSKAAASAAAGGA